MPNATSETRLLEPLIAVRDLNFWYGDTQALNDINFNLFPQEILAFIGPSGCGKTTALKCLNRMHDDVRDAHHTGTIRFHGKDIYAPEVEPPALRQHFGWVAQKPNPFPMSVYDNVAYGARLHGFAADQADLDAQVEDCLRRAHLWDEVKDVLHSLDGTNLSGGQQQRLCVARALSTRPEVLLMDEPTGSIDPIATAHLEALMLALKANHAIIVITHSMNEARRVADRVAYFHLGRLLEIGATEEVFNNAQTEQARRFIAGKFG